MLKVVHDGEGSNEQVLLGESLLDKIVRDGARRMLAAALRAEVAAYIEAHVGEVGADVRKGLYLVQHIYGDLGTRPMADMDLLTTRRGLRPRSGDPRRPRVPDG